MFRVVFFLNEKFSITAFYGKKLVASEKAVPLPQTFVIQAPDSPDTSLPGGGGCFALKWPSSSHRLLLQRCLSFPFIIPIEELLRRWDV